MSTATAATNLAYINQMQMINAITQQTSLFTAMNSLLNQLNAGFKALVQAIIENTRVIGGLMISAKSFALSMMPHNTIPNQYQAPGTNEAMAFGIFNEGINKTAQALTNTIGNIGGGPTPTKKEVGGIGGFITNALKPVKSAVSGIASMGPQMAAMAIVTAPLQAFLEGLLEPLSMITDIFGAYGEVLGQMFLPLMQYLQPILLSALPVLQNIATFLGPIIQFLWEWCSPLGLLIKLIQWLIEVFGAGGHGLIEEFEALANIVISFGTTIGTVFGAIGDFFTKTIPSWFMAIPDLFNTALGAIGNFFTVTIPGLFWSMVQTIIGFFTNFGTWIGQIFADLWTEIATLGTAKTKTFG